MANGGFLVPAFQGDDAQPVIRGRAVRLELENHRVFPRRFVETMVLKVNPREIEAGPLGTRIQLQDLLQDTNLDGRPGLDLACQLELAEEGFYRPGES